MQRLVQETLEYSDVEYMPRCQYPQGPSRWAALLFNRGSASDRFAVLMGNAVSMLLTSMATSNMTAVILLTAAGFFLPAFHGPSWSLSMDLLPPDVCGRRQGSLIRPDSSP